ncbi:MAG TPA: glycosyltransferase [Streptosporangiaceae bacterium]|jgi:glycosyltransferase involved in cell wall biosynthesis
MRTPPRVAFVLAVTAGGTGRHAAMLAAGCEGRGLPVSVLAPDGARALFAAAGQATAFCEVNIGERPRPGRDAAAVLRLRSALAVAQPAVVHAHGMRAGAAASVALAVSRPRPPLLVTVHNGPPGGRLARLVHAALELVVARRADRVLCVSADLADRMRRRGAREPGVAVVAAPLAEPPSAAAVSRARSQAAGAGGGAGSPLVLAAGRLTAQKGFGTLLAAAERWQHRSPVPRLVIAGDGPLADELAGRASSAGLAAVFLGWREDVRALLAAADVLAVPSSWEGQPLLIQEALQAGVPIVASRVGGIPALTGPDAALLVPPGDPAALAAAVLRVLDEPGLAATLSKAALGRAAWLPGEQDAINAAIAEYRRVTPDAAWNH